jgi:hypothetical protein
LHHGWTRDQALRYNANVDNFWRDNAWWVFGAGGVGTVVVGIVVKRLLKGKQPSSPQQPVDVHPVTVGKTATSNSIGAVTVEHIEGDSFIGNQLIVHKHAASEQPKAADKPVVQVFLKLEEALKLLRDAPPYQRRKVQSNLVGQHISEVCRFVDARDLDGGLVEVSVAPGSTYMSISFKTTLHQHPELKTMLEDTRILVQGRVSNVVPMELEDASFSVLPLDIANAEPPPAVEAPVVLVNQSIDDMESSVRDMTTYEAATVCRSKYKGKWVEEEVTFRNLVAYKESAHALFVTKVNATDVSATFSSNQLPHLTHRKIGESIRIRGRIESVVRNAVTLSSCEIVA